MGADCSYALETLWLTQGVNATGLTLPGFLFLHALFIERGRLETVWAVLRKYGYNNDLTLNQDILSEISFAHSPDQVCATSPPVPAPYDIRSCLYVYSLQRCGPEDIGASM